MAYTELKSRRIRRNFAKIPTIVDIPYLIEIQKESYKRFLQKDNLSGSNSGVNLRDVLKSMFPISDFKGLASLEFIDYSFGNVKYSANECRQRGMTYASPLKTTVRLVLWYKDEQTGAKSVRDIKEQEVYFGEFPLMTEHGTFIINGTERVIVSQMHKSPGVFFDHDKGKVHPSGKLLYSARIIPYRGSWIDLEFDAKDVLYVRVDRRRKFSATTLLRAIGCSTEDILRLYYPTVEIIFDGKTKEFFKKVDPVTLLGRESGTDITDQQGKTIVRKGYKFTKASLKRLETAKIDRIPVEENELIGEIAVGDILDVETGEIMVECSQAITAEAIKKIIISKISKFDILAGDDVKGSLSLKEALASDNILSQEQAILTVYKRLRPGDLPTVETANIFFQNLFFNPKRYDLSKVGRLKLDKRLGLNAGLDVGILTKEDILTVVKYLIGLKNGEGRIDDIDHLGTRRVRSVGELLENQFRIGLVRMERAVKERMSILDLENVMPHDLVNAKPIMALVKEFFCSSQLSQFMDQTNPLAEITHKRRLSALGPGGLTRERAGFEVRDVHPTHYGRICPIETPEGPNIGLITSLSTYARINEFGFIETPYRKVNNSRVTDKIEYLSAHEEDQYIIAQANVKLDSKGKFIDEWISARSGGNFITVTVNQVDFVDVSPKQIVSVAASLIPFLENDDANRALMGSNMQRQAVPLLKSKAPLVGTGMESIAARDSSVVILARRDGVVEKVDTQRIIIRTDEPEALKNADLKSSGIDIYDLIKYQRSNQNTYLNQKPIVKKGESVRKGQIIADGSSTEMGELALGRNILVAFMPWEGFNFEDAILVSEKLVKDDVYTSIHIEEFDVESRDTKLGKEEITRDIPNVAEDALRNLDESGIIRIAAEVKPGDILVGKVTPKGETQLTPEEKLLRTIFGEKAGDVRDSSLVVPHGIEGTIIDVKIFSRKGVEKDERAKTIEDKEIFKLESDYQDEVEIVNEEKNNKIKSLLLGKVAAKRVVCSETGKTILKANDKLTMEMLNKVPEAELPNILILRAGDVANKINLIVEKAEEQIHVLKTIFDEKIGRLKRGDELPPGVIKLVKVYVAIKRKLSVGDKMAGRHGNKGVVSKILPVEDMPYLPDGTPIDIVLNPLGVPSRMNVGQILETHLGWAAKELGEKTSELLDNNAEIGKLRKWIKDIYESPKINKFLDESNNEEVIEFARKLRDGVYMACPVFDGPAEDDIKKKLKQADLPVTGKTVLYDGRTGETFDQKVTVGYIYIMKLHHLVDDKIHARSIGPYSLVTQQPLGGKAQFGGQRFGEMEVWALEAYGAAYTLQEMLTVKSDDVAGRTKIYEAIVRGNNILSPGLPESFNVLIKELQSLALDVDLLNDKNKESKG